MIADRAKLVPPGQVIKTGYVPVFDCVLSCRDRMAIGDVEVAYRRLLQQGDHCMWPCPNGMWDVETGKFYIHDGRHEWVAAVMLGKSHLLVAWLEEDH